MKFTSDVNCLLLKNVFSGATIYIPSFPTKIGISKSGFPSSSSLDYKSFNGSDIFSKKMVC